MATVVLDVEGILFKTRISTLTSVRGCFFDNIFSRDWRSQLDKVEATNVHGNFILEWQLFHR